MRSWVSTRGHKGRPQLAKDSVLVMGWFGELEGAGGEGGALSNGRVGTDVVRRDKKVAVLTKFGNNVLVGKVRRDSPLFLDVVKQVRLDVHRWVPLAQPSPAQQHARSCLCGSTGWCHGM